MRADDERARLQEKELGIEADRIMSSPVWQHGYEELARDINARMLSASSTDEETIECKRELLALHKVKRHLETVMATGQMADRQLEEARDGRAASKH